MSELRIETSTCDLCGQIMGRTEDDCWHPFSVERACPPEPGPQDGRGWDEFYAKGWRPGRPGREHFIPGGVGLAP